MPGNSQRKGAKRSPGSKKGAVVGSGGAKSKGLRPKGPTPRATDRTKAAKRSSSPRSAERTSTPRPLSTMPAVEGGRSDADRDRGADRGVAPRSSGEAPRRAAGTRSAPRGSAGSRTGSPRGAAPRTGAPR
ncbi:MAG TPA: hypothetical protein VIJ54_06900, partial [Actinomycetes bacterium]